MKVSRLLNTIGGLAIAVGVGTMAYAHIAVDPALRRSVDVARQAVNDGAAALVLLSESVEATEALRPPTEEVTRRSVALLKPAIALLEGLSETVRLIPGAGGAPPNEGTVESSRPTRATASLPGSLAKLGRAVDTLTEEAQGLRKAALALEAETGRHPSSTLQPVVAAVTARIGETQNILADTDPAGKMTLLADLIAGIYLVMGGTLIAVARTVEQ